MTSKDVEIDEHIQKLSTDIEDFVKDLKPTPYKDGWAQDNWEEEMEKHPFFMQKVPDGSEELSPLMEGLQQLKYDEVENTPEELATTYKDEGNLNFKCKKYKKAIINYEEGLKQKCSDNLKAQLYNNCAAAHFFIKNYRLALNSSKNALTLNPDYCKAEIRVVQCLFHLEKYDECIDACNKILSRDPENSIALSHKKDALSKKNLIERDMRKEEYLKSKDRQNTRKTLRKIAEKKIKIFGTGDFKISDLQPIHDDLKDSPVHLDEDGILTWPVSFLFPQYHILEFVKEFRMDETFQDHINEMFKTPAYWDKEGIYTPDNIVIYYTDMSNNRNEVKVPRSSTLEDVLTDKRFTVYGGTPAFFAFVSGSEVESYFLENTIYKDAINQLYETETKIDDDSD